MPFYLPELSFYFPGLPFYFPEVPFCFLELAFCFLKVPFCGPKMLFCFSKMTNVFQNCPLDFRRYLLLFPVLVFFHERFFFPGDLTFSLSYSELLIEIIFSLFCFHLKLCIDQLMIPSWQPLNLYIAVSEHLKWPKFQKSPNPR